MRVMALGGKTGVNIFVLITGYFSSGKIRTKKIADLIGCATFYSLALTAVAVLTGSVAFSSKMLLKAAVPLLFGDTYWFIVTYLELYILIPLLNMVVERLEGKPYRNYLLLFAGLLCILPTVVGKFIHVNDLGYNALVWFVYLYFLGAYLRRCSLGGGAWQYICGAVVMMAIQIAACTAIALGVGDGILGAVLVCISDYGANAVFPLTIAVAMCLGFQRIRISGGKRLLQTAGAATLGIYLFHDNANLRGWLWENVYRLTLRIAPMPFAIHAVITVIAVFALGFAVEFLRNLTAKKLQGYIRRNKNETSLHHCSDQ